MIANALSMDVVAWVDGGMKAFLSANGSINRDFIEAERASDASAVHLWLLSGYSLRACSVIADILRFHTTPI